MRREKATLSSSSLPCSPGRRHDSGNMEDVNMRKVFGKQAMYGRDVAWERRRRQERRRRSKSEDLTDEDLDELRGSIELGFGFREDEGQKLCNTLPALDFYFAVNRGLNSTTLPSLPRHKRSYSTSSLFLSAQSSPSQPNLNICNPGDDPQQVKMKLRHWAQAVACSVKQTY